MKLPQIMSKCRQGYTLDAIDDLSHGPFKQAQKHFNLYDTYNYKKLKQQILMSMSTFEIPRKKKADHNRRGRSE